MTYRTPVIPMTSIARKGHALIADLSKTIFVRTVVQQLTCRVARSLCGSWASLLITAVTYRLALTLLTFFGRFPLNFLLVALCFF